MVIFHQILRKSLGTHRFQRAGLGARPIGRAASGRMRKTANNHSTQARTLPPKGGARSDAYISFFPGAPRDMKFPLVKRGGFDRGQAAKQKRHIQPPARLGEQSPLRDKPARSCPTRLVGTIIAELLFEGARPGKRAKDNLRLRAGDNRRLVMRADRGFPRCRRLTKR